MRSNPFHFAIRPALFALALMAVSVVTNFFTSSSAISCACGCGLFDVSTNSVIPTSARSTVYFQYSFMNQNQNWHSTSKADGADNDDKDIRTSFVTLGEQTMFSRSWGLRVEVPYWQRSFTTFDDASLANATFSHGAIGDMKIQGIYSGLSDDMSTGLIFGLKLPTGDSKYGGFDRDTEIGTGSLDLLLGAYHLGLISSEYKLNWFSNLQWQQPLLIRDTYRPGAETDLALGGYYLGWDLADTVRLMPMAQILLAYRLQDTGMNSKPSDSGYGRTMVAPGVEFSWQAWRVNADVAVPVYTWVRGNQLVAPLLYQLMASTQF